MQNSRIEDVESVYYSLSQWLTVSQHRLFRLAFTMDSLAYLCSCTIDISQHRNDNLRENNYQPRPWVLSPLPLHLQAFVPLTLEFILLMCYDC